MAFRSFNYSITYTVLQIHPANSSKHFHVWQICRIWLSSVYVNVFLSVCWVASSGQIRLYPSLSLVKPAFVDTQICPRYTIIHHQDTSLRICKINHGLESPRPCYKWSFIPKSFFDRPSGNIMQIHNKKYV